MFAIGIQYLNGWAMAADPGNREVAEWPPHPDQRVHGSGGSVHFRIRRWRRERARAAGLSGSNNKGRLKSWPRLRAARRPMTTFVPVNDSASPIKNDKTLMPAGSLPIGRDRQPRQFPVAIPDHATVFLHWTQAEASDPQRREALTGLVAKVAAVGHSPGLLVQMWAAPCNGDEVTSDSRLRRLQPSEGAVDGRRLRVFGPGRLRQLEQHFKQGQRPISSHWAGYAVEELKNDQAMTWRYRDLHQI